MLFLTYLLIVFTGLDHRFFAGQPGVPSISLAEAGAYGLAAALGLYVAIVPPQRRQEIIRWVRGANPYVLLYVAWLVATSLLNLLVLREFNALHNLKDALPGILILLGMVTILRRPSELVTAHGVLFLTTGVMALLAMMQVVFGGPYFNPVDPNAFMKLTISGATTVSNPAVSTLGHPNSLAVFLAPCLILEVGFLAYHRQLMGGQARVLAYLAVVLTGTAVWLTQAKAPIVWGTLGCATILFLRRFDIAFSARRALVLVGALCGAAVAGVLLLLAVPQIPGGIDAGTIIGRVIVNEQALELLRTNPVRILLGGAVEQLDMFTDAALRDVRMGLHNEFLSQVVRYGLPGAALYIGLLLHAILRQTGSGWVYATPLIFMALIFLLESATGSQLQAVMFILVAFADAHTRILRRTENGPPRVEHPASAGAAVGGPG